MVGHPPDATGNQGCLAGEQVATDDENIGGTASTPSPSRGGTRPSTAPADGAGGTRTSTASANGAGGTAPSTHDGGTRATASPGQSRTRPSRKRPAHQPVIEPFNRAIIVFVTVCTKDRQPLLANPNVHDMLVRAWNMADQWIVGRYVLMPDHLHLFCAPGVWPPTPLRTWVEYWKSLVARAVQGFGPLGGTGSTPSPGLGGTVPSQGRGGTRPSTASANGAGGTAPSTPDGGTPSTPSQPGRGGTLPSIAFLHCVPWPGWDPALQAVLATRFLGHAASPGGKLFGQMGVRTSKPRSSRPG